MIYVSISSFTVSTPLTTGTQKMTSSSTRIFLNAWQLSWMHPTIIGFKIQWVGGTSEYFYMTNILFYFLHNIVISLALCTMRMRQKRKKGHWQRLLFLPNAKHANHRIGWWLMRNRERFGLGRILKLVYYFWTRDRVHQRGASEWPERQASGSLPPHSPRMQQHRSCSSRRQRHYVTSHVTVTPTHLETRLTHPENNLVIDPTHIRLEIIIKVLIRQGNWHVIIALTVNLIKPVLIMTINIKRTLLSTDTVTHLSQFTISCICPGE